MILPMMLIPMVAALLACSVLTEDDDPPIVITSTPSIQTQEATLRIDDPPPPTIQEPEQLVVESRELARPLNAGDTSIEEKIIENDIIVKATMNSLSSEVVIDADGKYVAVLKFNLNVSDYLKGTGPSSIVAVWVDGTPYDATEDANAALATILAERDDQWDGLEAIIFLFDETGEFGTSLDAQFKLSDHFLLALGDRYFPDDRYSMHSASRKAWLPAASGTGSNRDGQEFLLDVQPDTGTPPTITLGDLKMRIADVRSEFGGGDGSAAYKACVLEKYRHIRNQRNFPEEMDASFTIWNIDQRFASGQPAGTAIDTIEAYGVYPDTRITLRFEGRDADLFDSADSESVDIDEDGDGAFDTIKYEQMVSLARPVPAGEYRFDLLETWPEYALCNFDISNEWTVTATAPDGTLHEAFFDPITDGTAVAADATKGVLKPATFTDADSASATLERIEWESGTVKFELSSDDALVGQVANFIELDGTVSLSLNADDATVDNANDTLSWSVASQPWENGDKLMLRIRETRGTCWKGTAVPNPSANPGLVLDCINLLAAKDTLRGTATLNWSVDTAITSWDGVKIEGTPSRVTQLRLPEKALDGSVPAQLAGLTYLKDLRLYGNRLTGEIPAELSGLSNLVALHLDHNRLTGPIPPELGSLSNLRDLFLGDNQLTGAIPTQLGNLSNLKFMNLDANRLTGGVPTQLGSLTNLQDLSLSRNQLTGSIPTQLGDLTKLRDLYLNDNRLTGSIPAQLGKPANLEVIDLSGNGLTGAIPTQLGDLTKLEELYLRGNQLTGAIPSELGDLDDLAILWLSGNTFTGCIPSALRDVDDHDLASLKLQYCAAPEA